MEQINELITLLLILIPAGGGVRILYCLISISGDEPSEDGMRRKIKHVLWFIVIAECLMGFVKVLMEYFPNFV